jgi:hypothetical protein
MRFFILVFLLMASLKSFSQKDSLKNAIPVFYKNDPSIYSKGIMEIPPSYLRSEPSFENLIPVKIVDTLESLSGKIGLVNRKGKFIVAAELDALGETSGKCLVIYKQSKAGLIDSDGNLIIDTKYKSINFINKDTIKVRSFPIWKVHDRFNKTIAEYTADSMKIPGSLAYDLFVNGKMEKLIHPEWLKQELVTEDQDQKVLAASPDPYRFVKINNKISVENLDCNLIVPPNYDSIRYIGSDSIFMVYSKKKAGIRDKDGSELMPMTEKFQKIFNFHNGRAKVLKDGRYGFIDRLGNIHISPQYPDAYDFSENAVAVVIAGKWGFLDKDENIIVQPFYQEVKNFKHGTARVKEKNKWFFVNNEGRKITTTPYDEILESDNRKWLLVTKGKFGLADTSGKEMLAPKYDKILDLGNGFVIVKKLNKWGVLDYKQNFLLPIEYDGLVYDKYNHHFLTSVNGKEELIFLSKDKRKGKGKQ